MSSIHPENTNHINNTEAEYDEPVAPARFDTDALRQAKPAIPVSRLLAHKPKSSILIITTLLAALLGGILGGYLSIRYMSKSADTETSVAESISPQEHTENSQADNTTKPAQADQSSGSTSMQESRMNKQEQPTNQTRNEKDKAEKKELDTHTAEETPPSDTPNQQTGRENRQLQEAFYNWLEANKEGDVNRQMRYYNSKVNAFYRWRNANIS
jgi:flagellar biosynthesis GTPase FlhF